MDPSCWCGSDKSPQLWHLPRKLLNFSTRLMTLLSQTVLRSRPMITYFTALIKGLVFSNYGSYWRLMKKLSVQHLLSASNQELVGHVRREEIRMMVKSRENAAKMGEIVDISEKVQGLLEDIVYKIVLGCNKDDQFDMKGLVSEGLRLAGALNFADIVPW